MGCNDINLWPCVQLRLQVQYQRTLNMVLTVDAHVMNDLQHNKPQHWNPDITTTDKHSELDNARIQKHLKVGLGPAFIQATYYPTLCLSMSSNDILLPGLAY
jgi:uncharacterized protein (DUF2237 family)